MGEFGISGLIKDGELERLEQCDTKLIKIKNTYVDVAKELAKGIKMEIETPKELDKLFALYSAQVSTAEKASTEFNVTLEKQKKVLLDVADNLQKQTAAGDLSAKEMKQLADVNEKNASALEKVAKAELAVNKVQNAGSTTRKNVALTEEQRLKVIKDAISLSNREVHSITEAETANKRLRQAVKLIRDTDADYLKTLSLLNSTIGKNTNYVKANSDAYTKQKMTIGDYKTEVKAAMAELGKGNRSLKNFTDLAKGCGGVLKSHVADGFNDVGMSIGRMVKGFIGAQAIIAGMTKLFQLLKGGVNTAIEFEAANSKLAAILGTTADKTKNLQLSARELGATTKYTAAEATNLQIELAKLGFTAEEIQQSTKYILQFAQATGAALPEAAALAGAALRMFNADTIETERYVSSMAVATTKSALSFSYLQTALPIAGSVAKTFGFEIEDVLALLGKLADSGVDASSAATATRNILLNLADGGGKLSKALGGSIKTLDDFVKGLQHVKDGGMELAEMLDITDKRSVNAFANFVNGANDIADLRKEITGCTKEFGAMALEMSNNTAGALKGLSSAWDELMISIYGNTGAIRAIVETVTEAIRDLAQAFESAETSADKLINKASTSTARESDYQRDIDAVERRKNAKIAAGKEENEAQKEALKEQEQLLKESLKKENELRDKAKKEYEAMLKNANDENYRFQSKAREWLKEDANKLATYIESSNVLEARLKKVQNLLSENNNSDNGVTILTDKQKKELEKQAKEQQRIREALQQSELELMDEGLQKELSKIAFNYNKKIAAVKGYSKEEIATRENLAKEMQNAVNRFTIQYNTNREKQDIANALEVVQKGSEEELALKLRQLDMQREAEIDAAEKTGEDVFAIDQKFASKKQQILEENAAYQVQLIAENAAAEQLVRDQQYQTDMLALKKQLAEKQITKKEYAEQEYQITLDYVQKTSEAAIEALELELKTDNLSAEERAKITEELYKLKAELAQKATEAEIKAIDDTTKADEDAKKKRLKNLREWLQTASEAIGAIGDLAVTLYDGKIQKVEDEQDANDEAYDRDVERIEKLAESGAISEEEAEIRKRAAKEKTEAKNRELEKKKQELARKQAIWDKATNIAQASIATALAITKALPNFVLAAIVGAIGAIQIATIAATPIPSYAEGTKGNSRHPGGKALVGDAGKREVVMYNGTAWITPDTPMLVDLPKGAQVFPDVNDFGPIDWQKDSFSPMFSFLGNSDKRGNTTVYNDYSGLERRMDTTNNLLMQSMKQRRREAYNREFDLYILNKL